MLRQSTSDHNAEYGEADHPLGDARRHSKPNSEPTTWSQILRPLILYRYLRRASVSRYTGLFTTHTTPDMWPLCQPQVVTTYDTITERFRRSTSRMKRGASATRRYNQSSSKASSSICSSQCYPICYASLATRLSCAINIKFPAVRYRKRIRRGRKLIQKHHSNRSHR